MGRSKRARWVLKKIILGVIKNNTQWFWCQTISIHQSFYILAIHFDCHYYTSKNIVMYRLSGTGMVDIDPVCSAVDRSSGTGRKTIWLLYTICLLNWLHGRALCLPKARRVIFNCCCSHCSAA